MFFITITNTIFSFSRDVGRNNQRVEFSLDALNPGDPKYANIS